LKPALLVIDVQKEYIKPGTPAAHSLQEATPVINSAIALFRRIGLPVVSIQHISEKDHVIPGTPGFEVVEELAILPSDFHIHKRRSSSFVETPLREKLREMGVDCVLLTGFCAEYCVLSTFRSAWDLDLSPIIVLGGLISATAENIPFVERISEVVSLGALEKFLAGSVELQV
jgi:nicotinamidase-related amidase